MKNAIGYYYNLFPNDIHQINGQYRFCINQECYCFVPYLRNPNDINYLYEISNFLLQNYIYCHMIIPNISHSYITIINQEPFVLLKVFVDDSRSIQISDLFSFYQLRLDYSKYSSLKKNHWDRLWSYKVDYFEYQINQFGKKYPLLRESFSYFVGIAENCIALLHYASVDSLDLVIAHHRIAYDDSLFEFYNPLNFIIDFKVRDVCEYFKNAFFQGIDIFDEVVSYLNYGSLRSEDYYLFFIRMLYPSYYFDIYEEILLGDEDDEQLENIIVMIPQYENLLQRIYWYMREFVELPMVDWLIRT